MRIRLATAEDGSDFLRLVAELAAFEKLPGPDAEGTQRLLADAFGEHPRYQLWVCELDAAIVAYAVTFETYSTFRALPTLYMEDLFVHPQARRRGVATAMLRHLEELARDRGCGRFEWVVLTWNHDAQALYERVGARVLEDWRLMRIDF